MNARGYTRESNPALADLDINVLAIKVNHVATMYPGYWWGYYGWYYPYYPYYPYSYTYTYQTGTLVIDISTFQMCRRRNKSRVLWTNFNNGVLGVSGTSTSVAVDAVNQAFRQSEYIQAN
jgi:hypothetical protein